MERLTNIVTFLSITFNLAIWQMINQIFAVIISILTIVLLVLKIIRIIKNKNKPIQDEEITRIDE